MKHNFTKEELQKLFGPKVIELTERPSHIGPAPYLVVEKGTTEEEKREIGRKFQEWRHQIFIESVGCKNDEEWQEFVTGKVKRHENTN